MTLVQAIVEKLLESKKTATLLITLSDKDHANIITILIKMKLDLMKFLPRWLSFA